MTGEPRHLVLLLAPLYPPAFRGGGPIRSIESLARSSPQQLRPLVLTSNRDLGCDDELNVVSGEWVDADGVTVRYEDVSDRRRWLRALRDASQLRPELVHLNSFFNVNFSGLPLLLSLTGAWRDAVILLAPRGEFSAGALSKSSTKKRWYMRAFRLLGLHRRIVWHSTADHETADIRRIWGTDARVIMRPNESSLLPDRADAPVRHHGEALRAVFLSRITHLKGLHIALEALRSVDNPVHFTIYGAAEDASYRALCEAIARELPPNIEVNFAGLLTPDAVRPAFADADVLVLPTTGENFGHVFAEALSTSCAVVTTDTTPWSAALTRKGGRVVVGRDIADWSAMIEQLAGLDGDSLFRLRTEAGEIYNEWVARPKEPHVWVSALESVKSGPENATS